jgi:hypothetical protein
LAVQADFIFHIWLLLATKKPSVLLSSFILSGKNFPES